VVHWRSTEAAAREQRLQAHAVCKSCKNTMVSFPLSSQRSLMSRCGAPRTKQLLSASRALRRRCTSFVGSLRK
jgi:hypothetical protein